MKYRFLKFIAPLALAAVAAIGTISSCSNDLDQSIKDPQTNTTFDSEGLLAKIYGNLHLTGTIGASGNADMQQFDEGNSSLHRRVFEAQELCSDECIWTWQGDAGIPELTNISWNSSHGYNELTYYRIMYNITLCNFYLDQTEGTTDTQMLQNRAEVRFIRALHYYFFIDLYGKAPFKTHYNDELPVQISRADCFKFVVEELKSIIGEENVVQGEVLLQNTNDDKNYGRASIPAAQLLLARLYLNAGVYTGTPQWQLAKDYADAVINSGYGLCMDPKDGFTAYEQLFMGDNGENENARQEIIFPIRCDGTSSRSYGAATYCIASCTGSGTPTQGLASSQWTCNRARQALVLKFFNSEADIPFTNDMNEVRTAAADDRAMFYTGADADGNNQRTFSTEEKTTFTAGLGILKWTNVRSDGTTPSDVSFPDTDVPLFRVAEAYLTRAEANYRLGNAEALNDINTLRERANAQPLNSLSESDLIDEWCREFYFEGRRRSDLIRFGLFTSGSYVWDWKGGAYAGTGVQSFYNLYPIPANELAANANMTQNPGY